MTVPLIDRDSEYLHRLGCLTAEQEIVVDGLILAVSAAVQRYCRRDFAATDHDEIQPVGEDGLVFLDNYPVINVDRIISHRIEALRVTNTTATSASVTTSDEKIRLTSVIGGGKTTETIAYVEAPTLDALATEIVGLGGGWTASVLADYTNHPTADLVSGQFKNCRARAGLALWVDSDDEISIDAERGILRSRAIGAEIRVQYRAGFACIPDDLQQVVAVMVADKFDGWRATVQSESLGDYSVSYAIADFDMPFSAKKVLSSYRDRRP